MSSTYFLRMYVPEIDLNTPLNIASLCTFTTRNNHSLSISNVERVRLGTSMFPLSIHKQFHALRADLSMEVGAVTTSLLSNNHEFLGRTLLPIQKFSLYNPYA